MSLRFRHRDKDGGLYTVLAYINEPVVEFGEVRHVTFIYCKDKDGNAFKIPYDQLFRYE